MLPVETMMNNCMGSTDTRGGKPEGVSEMQQTDVLEKVSKLVKDLYDSVTLIKKLESEMNKNAGLEDHFKKVIISQQQRFRTDVWKNLEDILKGYDLMLKYWSPRDVSMKISRLSRLSIEEINIVISHCIQLEDRLRQDKDKQVPGRFTRTCESGEILIDYSQSLEMIRSNTGSYRTNRFGAGTRVLVDPGGTAVAQHRIPTQAPQEKYSSRTAHRSQRYFQQAKPSVPPSNDAFHPFNPPYRPGMRYPVSIADVHSVLYDHKSTGLCTEKPSLVPTRPVAPPHFPTVARPPTQQHSRSPRVPYYASDVSGFQGPSLPSHRPSLTHADWSAQQANPFPAISSSRIPCYSQSYPVHNDNRLREISSTRQRLHRYAAYPPKAGLSSVAGGFRNANHIPPEPIPNPDSQASPAQPPTSQAISSCLLLQILNEPPPEPFQCRSENHMEHSTSRNGLLPLLTPGSKQLETAPVPVGFRKQSLEELEPVVDVHDPTVPQKLMLKNDRLQAAAALETANEGVEIVEVGSDEEEDEKENVEERYEEDDIEILEERIRAEDPPSTRVRMCAQIECMNVGVRICKRCHSVIYCSDTCQLKHWRLKHKGECEKLRLLREK